MLRTAIAASLALLALPRGAAAAEPPTDDALVKLCTAEILERDGQDAAGAAPKVASVEIARTPEQEVVTLALSLAEGRTLRGRCVIRDGKIFDFKS